MDHNSLGEELAADVERAMQSRAVQLFKNGSKRALEKAAWYAEEMGDWMEANPGNRRNGDGDHVCSRGECEQRRAYERCYEQGVWAEQDNGLWQTMQQDFQEHHTFNHNDISDVKKMMIASGMIADRHILQEKGVDLFITKLRQSCILWVK